MFLIFLFVLLGVGSDPSIGSHQRYPGNFQLLLFVQQCTYDSPVHSLYGVAGRKKVPYIWKFLAELSGLFVITVLRNSYIVVFSCKYLIKFIVVLQVAWWGFYFYVRLVFSNRLCCFQYTINHFYSCSFFFLDETYNVLVTLAKQVCHIIVQKR